MIIIQAFCNGNRLEGVNLTVSDVRFLSSYANQFGDSGSVAIDLTKDFDYPAEVEPLLDEAFLKLEAATSLPEQVLEAASDAATLIEAVIKYLQSS